MEFSRITLLGDGGWGTAMALLLAGKGLQVVQWGYDPAYLGEMERTRSNPRFLPGFPLPERIVFEPDLDRALREAELLCVAIPTKFLRPVLGEKGGALAETAAVVSLTKGIEPASLRRPSQLLRTFLHIPPERIAVVSGPSHAEEVAQGLPTTVVAASVEAELAEAVQQTFLTDMFRVYTSRDVIGVETGGALKNVIALAAGICTGLGLGDNAMAALLTRGLAEIARLGISLGADGRTFAGLSGMGDLVVTCASRHSRNRRVGVALGEGRKLADILAETPQVAEGVTTAESACGLKEQTGVDMPILTEVYQVLYEEKDPRQAVIDLMTRDARPE